MLFSFELSLLLFTSTIARRQRERFQSDRTRSIVYHHEQVDGASDRQRCFRTRHPANLADIRFKWAGFTTTTIRNHSIVGTAARQHFTEKAALYCSHGRERATRKLFVSSQAEKRVLFRCLHPHQLNIVVPRVRTFFNRCVCVPLGAADGHAKRGQQKTIIRMTNVGVGQRYGKVFRRKLLFTAKPLFTH